MLPRICTFLRPIGLGLMTLILFVLSSLVLLAHQVGTVAVIHVELNAHHRLEPLVHWEQDDKQNLFLTCTLEIINLLELGDPTWNSEPQHYHFAPLWLVRDVRLDPETIGRGSALHLTGTAQ